MGRGCSLGEWAGGSGRWSRQARARGRGVKSEIGEGEMCVRVEMGSKGHLGAGAGSGGGVVGTRGKDKSI